MNLRCKTILYDYISYHIKVIAGKLPLDFGKNMANLQLAFNMA